MGKWAYPAFVYKANRISACSVYSTSAAPYIPLQIADILSFKDNSEGYKNLNGDPFFLASSQASMTARPVVCWWVDRVCEEVVERLWGTMSGQDVLKEFVTRVC